MINDFYYLTSEGEGRCQMPHGFVTKYVCDYAENILPAVLSGLPEEFASAFMERYSFCGELVRKVDIDLLSRTVTLVLERYTCIDTPHTEISTLEFLDVHPIRIGHDDEDYPLPLKGDVIFGFFITFSSKSNRTKPSSKRPYRCNILLNNRLSIDLIFSSIRFNDRHSAANTNGTTTHTVHHGGTD